MAYKIKGFLSNGISVGIKKDGKKDLGLIFSEREANISALFTKNKIKAAPLLIGIEKNKIGKAQAFIVNSGNANCATGKQGLIDATKMTTVIAKALNISSALVIPSSTGVIGEKLPIKKIEAKADELVSSLDSSFEDFAEAILTTDTKIKIVTKEGKINKDPFSIVGIIKGAGMIKPNMATLLCYILTDIKASSAFLKKALKKSCDISLNRLSIDGDTSTNDSIFIMANGASKTLAKNNEKLFQSLLDETLIELSKKLIQDGEGVNKLVQINVKGAKTKIDAYTVAESVAESSLVKTAIFGEDANWGRIMMAIGNADAKINPSAIDIFFDDIQMAKNSLSCGKKTEAKVSKILKKKEFSITIDLKLGKEKESFLTCDLSYDYIKINSDYRS